MEYFYRSPRFWREIQPYRMQLDLPPPAQNKETTPLMLTLGPSVTMGMAAMATAIYGILNGNLLSAVTSGCMLIGMVLFPVITRRYERKKQARAEELRQEKYRAYLRAKREELYRETERQRELCFANAPDTENCVRRIRQKSRNLWERSADHDDFLRLRVGIGTRNLQLELAFPERKFSLEEDALIDEAYRLVTQPKRIAGVPLTVSLREHPVTGIIGERRQVLQLAHGLVLQLSALYGYDELKLVFFTTEEEFAYVRWIPHVWTNDRRLRFYACDAAEGKTLKATLKKLLSGERLSAIPHYVVFAMNRELAIRSDLLAELCEQSDKTGVSLLCFFDALRYLPKECSNVIDLRHRRQGEMYHKNDSVGETVLFEPDCFIAEAEMKPLAFQLANTFLDLPDEEGKLPKELPFLELFGAGNVTQLAIRRRWKENNPTRSLAVPIGMDIHGDGFFLDFHEKADGPHGLVAGMTGSGKSEFLITVLLALAVCFCPEEVSFVLIDYKGGGMGKALEALPHTAGVITNLDGAEQTRMLLAIQSELRRRQQLFAAVGRRLGRNPDIYLYQQWYREGRVEEPLAHLFLVCDEFAELKSRQPEFMAQLISTARIGRSLGVHLILATQKPGGVVDDQIWSNARFRACLKVQDRQDSMDMLKRPEAAELTAAGRFYLQIGYNESFRLGQSAWTGGLYAPKEEVKPRRNRRVEVIDRLGRVMLAASPREEAHSSAAGRELDAIIAHIRQVAEEEGAHAPPLWLPPLPPVLAYPALRGRHGKEKGALPAPVVGLSDDPGNQKQMPVALSFSSDGNVIVYGGSGSGKTGFVTMCLYALIGEYSPEEVALYVLDFAAETLGAFGKAPHVGDVIFSFEKEKVQHLFRLLEKEMQARKALLSAYGGSLLSYRQETNRTLPCIIVVLDGYTVFAELYEELFSSLLRLCREGGSYGLYFVVTSADTNAPGFRLAQNFPQVFALQLPDAYDYAAVLGNTGALVPKKCPGRGLMKRPAVLQFQVAVPFLENSRESIVTFCAEKNDAYRGNARAKPVPVLPDVVDAAFVHSYVQRESLCLPIGVNVESLAVCMFPFDQVYMTAVLSQVDDYVAFAAALAALVPMTDIKCLFLDGESRDRQALQSLIAEVFSIVLSRHNGMSEAADRGEELPEFAQMLVILSSFSSLRDALDETHREMLELICQKGSKALRVHLVVADSATAIAGCTYEKWFQHAVSHTDGIWIGSGFADQFLLKAARMTPDMRGELPESFGFVVKKGRAQKVKLLGEGIPWTKF